MQNFPGLYKKLKKLSSNIYVEDEFCDIKMDGLCHCNSHMLWNTSNSMVAIATMKLQFQQSKWFLSKVITKDACEFMSTLFGAYLPVLG
jgi:hypothetical protein